MFCRKSVLHSSNCIPGNYFLYTKYSNIEYIGCSLYHPIKISSLFIKVMEDEKSQSKISETLKKALEEKIVMGAYRPGARLDETELANEFSVSRTPVREALIQLASSGLVILRHRRGAVVAQASPQRLYEMFEVMAELEAISVRLAARRHGEADLRRLREAQAGCEAALVSGDFEAYYRANEEFHMAIYAASHNGFLCEETSSMHRRLGVYRRLQLRGRGRLQNSHKEHCGILEAIEAGDGELAARRVHAHITVQGETFSDLVASLALMHSDR